MKRILIMAIAAVFMAASAPAFGETEKIIEKLQVAEKETSRLADTPSKKRFSHKQKNNQINELLDRLERGEEVDPSEVDRLIR